jgi:hypothetical protein
MNVNRSETACYRNVKKSGNCPDFDRYIVVLGQLGSFYYEKPGMRVTMDKVSQMSVALNDVARIANVFGTGAFESGGGRVAADPACQRACNFDWAVWRDSATTSFVSVYLPLIDLGVLASDRPSDPRTKGQKAPLELVSTVPSRRPRFRHVSATRMQYEKTGIYPN